jgi:DeoR family transcriptional regulator, aga operon transcriptional repressor
MTPEPAATRASDLRRARILELVHSHDFVRVADLGEMLGVSSVTVRGDLDVLAAQGELRRIRGGAVSHEPGRGAPAGERRSEEHERMAIARLAAGLVEAEQCVFVGGGAFAPALAQAIGERRGLSGVAIVTNDLGVASALQSTIPRLTVMVTGGTLARRQPALVDPLGGLMFDHLHAHMALVGSEGVEAGAGVTAPDLGDAAVTRRMLEAAERRVVIAAGERVGAVQMAPVCGIDDVDVLVTGAGAQPAALKALRTQGVEVMVA